MPREDLPRPTERVQLYDAAGRPAGTADRTRMRAENLSHAATAVVVRDALGRVHVHRRTDSKDVHPGRHDFAAGGVVEVGEDPHEAALRELAEELGIAGVELEPVLVGHYSDDRIDCWGHCFTTTWDGPVTLQPEEVAWGDWWPVDRVVAELRAHPDRWMPDTAGLLGDWLVALATDRREPDHQGWDSHAEVVEGRWLDRSPRRPAVAAGLLLETQLLPRVAPRLPLAVPEPVLLTSEPLLVRHQLVPGRPVDPDRLGSEDGRRVGGFLRALHDTTPDTWAGTRITRDAERLDQLTDLGEQVLPLLPAELRDAGGALLERCREATRTHAVLRHGDLGPTHLLAVDGRVTGVIDWTDTALGDPALDLAWVVNATPAPFRDALLATYRPTGEELARGRDWHRLGPWWEVQHGLTDGDRAYVGSGLAGVVERLRATP